MKSKISCWRLVKSMSGLPGGPRCAERTRVREGSGGPGRNQPRAILASVRGSRRGPTCAGGGIGRRARLRALWAEWPVEVRVLFGALGKARTCGLFSFPASVVDGVAPLGPALEVAHEAIPVHRVLGTALGVVAIVVASPTSAAV